MNHAPYSSHRRLLLAAIASAAAATLLPACGRKIKGHSVPAGATVLALGDSLTQGVGTSSPAHAWPAVFERLSGWRMVNGGVSGDTSDMALARLPALLREHHPQLVIVSIGGNDFLHQNLPKIFADLARGDYTIVNDIQNHFRESEDSDRVL